MIELRDFLKQVGLNAKESNIYLSLLEMGPQAASVIAKRIGLPRTSIFYHLENLTKKGFIKKHNKSNIQYFSVISPEELEHLLARQKIRIENQMSQLENLLPVFKNIQPSMAGKSKVSHFEGVEGICKMIDLTLEKDEPLYFISAHAFHPEIRDYILRVYAPKRKRMKNKSQMIVIRTPESENYNDFTKEAYEWVGYADPEKVDFQSTIIIYGDHIQFLSVKPDDLNGMLIENNYLARTMRAVFELLKCSAGVQNV